MFYPQTEYAKLEGRQLIRLKVVVPVIVVTVVVVVVKLVV